MPELPEVETSRLGVLPYFEGKFVQDVFYSNRSLRYPVDQVLLESLKGQQAITIKRRAKYLLLMFSQKTIILHLGMSGHLRVEQDIHFIKKKHDHWVVFFPDKAIVYNDPRRFGFIVAADTQWDNKLAKLGPEPLEEIFSVAYLKQQLQKSQRAIKAIIMDQAVVVGVGNIYASEALFLARINPLTPGNKVSSVQVERLIIAIKRILAQAIKMGGTTLRDFVSGHEQPGYFKQSLTVYGREGQVCHQCGGVISKQVIQQRASFYCLTCQPLA